MKTKFILSVVRVKSLDSRETMQKKEKIRFFQLETDGETDVLKDRKISVLKDVFMYYILKIEMNKNEVLNEAANQKGNIVKI